MSDVDRIKLAEAMGWEWKASTAEGTEMVGRWYKDHSAHGNWVPYEATPIDPFTDANDCEALIKWLTEQGYTVVIQIWDTEALVDLETIDNRPNLKGNCDDYKQGVCELALKVLP